jgi:hypothetical protein
VAGLPASAESEATTTGFIIRRLLFFIKHLDNHGYEQGPALLTTRACPQKNFT